MYKLPSHYIYFAILEEYEEGVSVTFPDLPGCVTHGNNAAEAAKNAEQCLALHLCGMEEDGDSIPKPSEISDIKLKKGEALLMVDAFMPPMRDSVKNSIIKKTLTIPRWLNEAAIERNINFSQTLQKALMSELNIHR